MSLENWGPDYENNLSSASMLWGKIDQSGTEYSYHLYSLMWSECGTKSALQNLCTGITVFISVYACKLMWWRKSLCRSKESLGTTKVVIDFTAIWWPRSTKTASMLENYFYEKSCGINSGAYYLTTPTKSNYQRSKFIRHN